MRSHPRFLVWTLIALCAFATVVPATRAQDEGFEDEEWEEEEGAEEEEPADLVAEEDDGGDQDAEEEDLDDDELGGEETEGEEAAPRNLREDPRWARRFRLHNTIDGPTGGLRVVDAGSAGIRSIRVQLATEFFSASDFLYAGDEASRISGTLSFSWSALDFLELFAAIRSSASSNDRADPSLLLALGDLSLGAKIFHDLTPWLTVGGDLSLLLPTSQDLGVRLAGTGLAIRGNATADLRGLADAVPLIARVSLSYTFDNSSELVEEIESSRYATLEDPLDPLNETRHLLRADERFGLGISRTDSFDFAVGLEAPLEVATDFYLHPILEWALSAPVNRQGYDCPFVPLTPGSDTPAPGEDGCLDRQGAAAFPMSLTFGVRVLPPVAGLAGFIGVDVGLLGTGLEDNVRELPASAPYQVLLGLSYAFDLRPPLEPEIITNEVDAPVEVPAPVPPRGRVLGLVVKKGTEEPVPGALVRFPGRDLTPQVAGEDGRFITYLLDPGEVRFEIAREGFEPGTCAATIAAEGGDVELRCELEQTLVVIEESEVQILEQILFAFDSADILPESFGLMQQIARALQSDLLIRMVEIQGHTDDVGGAPYNLDLSQRRADSVRKWLTDAGVDPTRLRARGYGLTQPVVPNTDDASRARNRRVQFIIVYRGAPTGPGPATITR